MFGKTIFALSFMTFTLKNAVAIQCNFTFVENESTGLINQMAQIHIITPENMTSSKKFNCDQTFDEDLDYTFVNTSGSNFVGNRFGDYEETCVETKRFIEPLLLRNVYNELTRVSNGVTLIQRVQISQCQSRSEPCNEQVYPPVNYRFICVQDYLTIKLSALRNGGTVYEDEFYIPSGCSCRYVRISRRLKRARIVYV